MMYRRTHIRVDSNGDVVLVHWSPPFEGPLSIPPDRINDYYVARAAFNRMLDKMFDAAGMDRVECWDKEETRHVPRRTKEKTTFLKAAEAETTDTSSLKQQ